MDQPGLKDSTIPVDDPGSYHRIALQLLGEHPGSPVKLRVISDSMLPFIRAGDWIEVETGNEIRLNRGDIVVRLEVDPTRQPGVGWTVHRLVGKSGQGWLTKGDHFRFFDPPIPGEAILGRVFRIQRQGREINFQRLQPRLVNRCLGLYNFCLGTLFSYLHRMRGRVESGRGDSG